MPNDTVEIRAAAENFLCIFDNLDWEPFAACWSSDPTAFFPGDNLRLDGLAAVLARFRTFFDRVLACSPGPPYLHLNAQDLRVDRYGDAGLVTFTLGDPAKPAALRSLVFVREASVWKLAHLHATSMPPDLVLDSAK